MKLPQYDGNLNPNTIYLSNKYTRWYYCIINYAMARDPNSIGYRERHHIIPESFYINRIRQGPKGWLEGNPNDISNIVTLTPREHFICHWLLTKMVVGVAYTKMERALTYFQVASKYQERILSSGQYARIKLAASLKGCEEETRSKISKANTGKRRTEQQCQAQSRRLKGRHGTAINKLWWNNGSVSIRCQRPPGDGWTRGQLKKKNTMSWWTDGIINIRSNECPGPSFQIGRRVEKVWNNGHQCVQSAACPGPGWARGQIKNNSKWWNNGSKEVQKTQSPGVEWIPGRLKKTSNTMFWWNNGVVHQRCEIAPGPEWVKGRIYWRKPVT